MTTIRKRLSKATFVALLLTLGTQAQAALITYNVAWSGAVFGNTAEATAVIVIDDTLLPNPGSTGGGGLSVPLADLGIVSLDMEVTGASSGNGTFTEADFASVAWDTAGATLDLTTDLVGQATSGNAWGTDDGISGDFNLFSATLFSPSGTFFFELTTDGGFGDSMLLTSFAPVPIGPALPLFASAFGLLGFLRRKRV